MKQQLLKPGAVWYAVLVKTQLRKPGAVWYAVLVKTQTGMGQTCCYDVHRWVECRKYNLLGIQSKCADDRVSACRNMEVVGRNVGAGEGRLGKNV